MGSSEGNAADIGECATGEAFARLALGRKDGYRSRLTSRGVNGYSTGVTSGREDGVDTGEPRGVHCRRINGHGHRFGGVVASRGRGRHLRREDRADNGRSGKGCWEHNATRDRTRRVDTNGRNDSARYSAWFDSTGDNGGWRENSGRFDADNRGADASGKTDASGLLATNGGR